MRGPGILPDTFLQNKPKGKFCKMSQVSWHWQCLLLLGCSLQSRLCKSYKT